jgi:signal transduction histidine kinase
VYNLKTSLSQGAGFGSLVTLVDMMTATAEKDGDFYKIDSEIYEMIRENNAYCRLQMEGLHFASDTMDHDISLEGHQASEMIAELPIYLSKVESYLPEKKLKITYPVLNDNCLLEYNPEKIAIVTEELLVNAYKYAVPGSTINIFTRISEGYFWLSFKNDINEKPYGGVPEKYEKLVTEPFFRIQPPDESASRFERIGFGLGLAVADYILKKHNGIFIIHDVNDLTEGKKRLCVLSEILLPVKQML